MVEESKKNRCVRALRSSVQESERASSVVRDRRCVVSLSCGSSLEKGESGARRARGVRGEEEEDEVWAPPRLTLNPQRPCGEATTAETGWAAYAAAWCSSAGR
mmetsp:Transcript_14854/g.59526  ORF Transcript_14854/g.59526 Transcript_14854/m.59526 type:complete len:103 (-) Transcript_14854:533-841(-)